MLDENAEQQVEQQLFRLLSAIERIAPGRAPIWVPCITVTRGASGLEIAIDIPGVTRSDVNVVVDDRRITVFGHRTDPAWNERRVEACEVPVGTFMRTFELPAHVAKDDVVAELANGVLTIRIAQVREASSQIPIKS